jgi:hypothetical protein
MKSECTGFSKLNAPSPQPHRWCRLVCLWCQENGCGLTVGMCSTAILTGVHETFPSLQGYVAQYVARKCVKMITLNNAKILGIDDILGTSRNR